MVCVDFHERMETEEEMNKRIEEEEAKAAAAAAASKGKAKGKKEDEKPPPEPQKVHQAKENNLDVGNNMPKYVKWLVSQLQFCKDRVIRDVETKERIWKRIYP